MIFKILVSVALLCVVAEVYCEGQGAQHQGGVRKIKVVGPGAVKVYRMLGGGVVRQAVDDEDGLTDDESYFQKRQYDDYGHMRFGKRNPKDFDDYGHMRFGK